jgi:hypothetical protein
VISVARLVPTLPAPGGDDGEDAAGSAGDCAGPLLATSAATDSTVEAIPVPTHSAPDVVTKKREES